MSSHDSRDANAIVREGGRDDGAMGEPGVLGVPAVLRRRNLLFGTFVTVRGTLVCGSSLAYLRTPDEEGTDEEGKVEGRSRGRILLPSPPTIADVLFEAGALPLVGSDILFHGPAAIEGVLCYTGFDAFGAALSDIAAFWFDDIDGDEIRRVRVHLSDPPEALFVEGLSRLSVAQVKALADVIRAGTDEITAENYVALRACLTDGRRHRIAGNLTPARRDKIVAALRRVGLDPLVARE